jgi:hypothetical protein
MLKTLRNYFNPKGLVKKKINRKLYRLRTMNKYLLSQKQLILFKL